MFLVVEDQLRVSDGWVRCGRCANVFNAAEDLIDVEQGDPVKLDLGAPPNGQRPAALPGSTPDTPAPDRSETAPLGAERTSIAEPAPELRPLRAESPVTPGGGSVSSAPSRLALAPVFTDDDLAPLSGHADLHDASDSALDESLPDPLLRARSRSFEEDDDASQPTVQQAEPEPPTWHPLEEEAPRSAEPLADADDPAMQAPAAADAAPPSFVQQAENAERWRSSPQRGRMRWALVALGVVALLQLGLLWRHQLAAHVPGMAPAVRAAAGLFGQDVQALRRIDQLAVDSSALNRLDDAANPADHRYRLSVLLHNRADTTLMAPAVELTLSDVRGEVVVRRVLQLTDFGHAGEPLAAGQEVPLRLVLATGPRAVEGYTVELFYP